MAVKPWTPEDRRARVRAAMEALEESRTPEPEYVNALEALSLDRSAVKVLCGRPHLVGPIPYEYGLELHELLLRYHKPGAGIEETRRALRGMVHLFPKLARPVGWRRWFRWALPNPFRHASEREIIATADFFWGRRTGTPFHTFVRRAVESAQRSTGSMAGRSSHGSSPHGLAPTASRSPGSTTRSG